MSFRVPHVQRGARIDVADQLRANHLLHGTVQHDLSLVQHDDPGTDFTDESPGRARPAGCSDRSRSVSEVRIAPIRSRSTRVRPAVGSSRSTMLRFQSQHHCQLQGLFLAVGQVTRLRIQVLCPRPVSSTMRNGRFRQVKGCAAGPDRRRIQPESCNPQTLRNTQRGEDVRGLELPPDAKRHTAIGSATWPRFRPEHRNGAA